MKKLQLRRNGQKRYLSIKYQLLSAMTIFVFLITIPMDILVYNGLGKILGDQISLNLNLTARNEGMRLDQLMYNFEDQVNTITDFIHDYSEEAYDFKNDSFRKQLLNDTDKIFTSITANNEYAYSDYVYFNPSYLNGQQDGFLYLKNNDGVMKNSAITDISLYNENDIDHVGWFYLPQKFHTSVWMQPYFNQNLNKLIISYVSPIYEDEELICVVGMDIDFEKIIQMTRNNITTNGTLSYLTSMDNSTHYTLNSNDRIQIYNDEDLDYIKNEDLRSSKNTGDKVVEYIFNKSHKVMAFVTVKNGMKLVVFNDYDVLYSERNRMLNYIIIISLSIGILFILFQYINTSKLLNVFSKLTEAAKKLGNKDFDRELPDLKIKEFKALTDVLISTHERLLKHSQSMEMLAFRDEMTKVKNKTAYSYAIEAFQKRIESHDPTLEFGIVMCDLNFLKPINDRYGHEVGDDALKICAKVICDVYKNSPVYRIGGDEFVVILTERAYLNRLELECELDAAIARRNSNSNYVFGNISIAHGTAIYDSDNDGSFRDVFDRADAAMYRNKSDYHRTY